MKKYILYVLTMMQSICFSQQIQIGNVINVTKLNSESNQLIGKIHNGDVFGTCISSLGDFNKDGINDLIVGAPKDDANGENKGAIWLLLMNSDQTIKSAKKISQGEGGFNAILSPNEFFGQDVDTIGDLDKNGIVDIVVGACYDGEGGYQHGAVFILFMNADGTVKKYQKINDKQGGFKDILHNDNRFGHSVCGIGDFNKDGIPDIAVGAGWSNDGGFRKGSIWILYLDSTGLVKNSKKISSTSGNFNGVINDNSNFGYSISRIGDINNDGIDDLAIGAPSYLSGTGSVWILLMNSDGSVKQNKQISAQNEALKNLLHPDDFFGIVTSAGDVDKDGIPDIFVTAMFNDEEGLNTGKVFLLLLNENATVKYAKEININSYFKLNTGDNFGSGISVLNEKNGDLNVVVGARMDDVGGNDRGAIYGIDIQVNKILNCVAGTPVSATKISSTKGNFSGIINDGDVFGTSIASLGDYDHDGNADIVVGAPKVDDGGTDKGAIWMLMLNADKTIKSAKKISENNSGFNTTLVNGEFFGQDVDTVGDLDKNGVIDLVVGACYDADGGFQRGAVFILFMNADGTVKKYQKISNTAGNFKGVLHDDIRFGHSVCGIGDLNKDGINDIAVGSGWDNDGGYRKGSIWILFLDINGTVKDYQKISSTSGNFKGYLANEVNFGYSIARIGDLNKDGVEDLAVGTMCYLSGTGSVWVLFMNENGTVKASREVTSSDEVLIDMLKPNDGFCMVSSVGDINGDGVSDLLVGAMFDDKKGTDVGTTYLLYLNSNGSVKFAKTVSVPKGFTLNIGDNFGSNLSYLGTKNGLANIAVGARLDDDGGNNRGAVWLMDVCVNKTNDTVIYDTLKVSILPSKTIICPGESVNLFAEVTGGIRPYNYKWSDNISSNNSVRVYPSSNNIYSLTVTDTFGDSISTSIKINVNKINALFNIKLDSSTNTVSFVDSSSRNVLIRYWNFGDDSYSNEINPIRKFYKEGIYPVCLSVEDSLGLCHEQYCKDLKIGRLICKSNFTYFIESETDKVIFSETTIGGATNFYWDFGDGNTSIIANPVHIYSKPGIYQVSLNIFNSFNGCMSYSNQVIIISEKNIPCKADFVYLVNLDSNKVVFSNHSEVSDINGLLWDFGDGITSEEKNPIHMFNKGGFYNVCLSINNPVCNDISCQQVKLSIDTTYCLANFEYKIDVSTHTVSFIDKSFGNPDEWKWNFGDGGHAEIQNPTHIFSSSGIYPIHLNIKNHKNKCIDHFNAVINVGTMSDSIECTYGYLTDTVSKIKGNYMVNFKGASYGNPSQIIWDFGDGETSTSTLSPIHNYNGTGVYNVCLTVSNDLIGQSDVYCNSVLVTNQITDIKPNNIENIQLVSIPNPCKDETYIKFDLPYKSNISLVVTDITGNRIATIFNDEYFSIGGFSYKWNVNSLSTGIYFIQLSTSKENKVVKLIKQ